MRWFGLRFEPRFTNLEDQLQELYCADDPVLYDKCLIRPVGQIDQQLIISEKPNIDQIIATLGLKEMSQGTLIRKLCTYTAPNPTLRAIFEFDKLVRSIYTLRYLRDPQLERSVHRSQNRVESYHPLRSTIAQVGSLAAHPAERALHLTGRRQDNRLGRAHGRAGVGMTEFSAVPA